MRAFHLYFQVFLKPCPFRLYNITLFWSWCMSQIWFSATLTSVIKSLVNFWGENNVLFTNPSYLVHKFNSYNVANPVWYFQDHLKENKHCPLVDIWLIKDNTTSWFDHGSLLKTWCDSMLEISCSVNLKY